MISIIILNESMQLYDELIVINAMCMLPRQLFHIQIEIYKVCVLSV